MGRLSDKIKIVYLLLVILFSLGVFVYLLDTWGIIKLEEHIAFLKEEPPVVPDSDDAPSLLLKEKMAKERLKLEELEARLKEKELKLTELEGKLARRGEIQEERENGFKKEREEWEKLRQAELERTKLIREMAGRLVNMAPENARDIVGGWSNTDLVDVLREMERAAAADGRQSIVPYLITLLPEARKQVITSLMMDSEAGKLPGAE